MKKLLFSFVSLLVCITVYADVNIRYSTFPDANFRAWLLEQSYGADGVLTDAEIAKVTRMKFNNMEIKNLKGIEYFTSLKDLLCDYNQITSLDMSRFTQLDTLSCFDNQITSLNVSGCKSLRFLGCMYNPLISLNVSGCSSLKQLFCGNNTLSSLDISGCTALKKLDCSSTKLTSLDASECKALDTIYCNNCQLTSLKLAGGMAVKQALYCYGNKIKGTAMDALIASLPDVALGKMFAISDFDEGNIITTSQVAVANEKGWIVYQMDDSYNWQEYEGSAPIVEINETNFPDANFRQYLLEQTYGTDGILTDDEIGSVIFMSLYEKGIKTLKGIEFFTALKYLDCNNNQLTSLDVSKNTALTEFSCSNNQLESLDLTQNTALTYLLCYSNRLTSLDVSKNSELSFLDCGANLLTSLDVSNNHVLRYIFCENNKLASLDLTNNTNLTGLCCFANQIKGTSMDALVESLPTVERGSLDVICYQGEGNVITTTQVAAAKVKGWTSYYYNKYEEFVEYEGSSLDYLRGDANGDGEIGMPDVMFIVNYILGTPADTFNEEAADANQDGEIGMPDVMFIVNYILNGKFPDEE